MKTPRPRRVVILVTEDWSFVSHRLPLAVAAKAAGYDVTVVTRVAAHGDVIRGAGLNLVHFENSRAGLNPFVELLTVLRLVRLYRALRPDVVHHVAIKPVLYGSLAARLAGRPRTVNALIGMGWVFTSASGLASLLKGPVRWVLSRLLQRGTVIVQNPDDFAFMRQLGIAADQIALVPGSGVDLSRFRPTPEPPEPLLVILPARLLWDKGVGEFVAAARILRAKGVQARFLLASVPDRANPSAIPDAQIAEWVAEGIVEHPGCVSDMPSLLSACHVVCLPSYREGLPKALLEAAAAGRPIVTVDTPGCREVVRDGINGFVVPVRDAAALADALMRLLADPALRVTMGLKGRARAESLYGIDAINSLTLALYQEPT